MATAQAKTFRNPEARSSWPSWSLLAAVFALIAGLPVKLGAQSPAPSPPDPSAASPPLAIAVPSASRATADLAGEDPHGPLATLHLYANLMQVPVLVLTSDRQPLKPVPEGKFRIRMDRGPWFRPTHVRREGDDPIELALLIDKSRPETELLPGLAAALSSLAPGSLRSWDHVSVYVMGCGLTRTAYDLPADSATLRIAVDQGLATWRQPGPGQQAPGCAPALPLFDAMALVTKQLKTLPGRRALLVLTDGVDRGSRVDWNDLLRFEQSTSTAVFGLHNREERNEEQGSDFADAQTSLESGIGSAGPSPEDRFESICQSSGGMQFELSGRGLAKGLVRFVALLRSRYIVEFPRSDTATAGSHELSVSIPDAIAYVRPSGITVPLADRNLLSNPLTLSSQAEVPVAKPRRALDDDTSTPVAPEPSQHPPAGSSLPQP